MCVCLYVLSLFAIMFAGVYGYIVVFRCSHVCMAVLLLCVCLYVCQCVCLSMCRSVGQYLCIMVWLYVCMFVRV